MLVSCMCVCEVWNDRVERAIIKMQQLLYTYPVLEGIYGPSMLLSLLLKLGD